MRSDGASIAFGDPTNSYDGGFPPTNFCSTNSQSSRDLPPQAIAAPDGQTIRFGRDLYGSPGDVPNGHAPR